MPSHYTPVVLSLFCQVLLIGCNATLELTPAEDAQNGIDGGVAGGDAATTIDAYEGGDTGSNLPDGTTTVTPSAGVSWNVCSGEYTEPVATVDLTDLESGYVADQWWETALAVVDRGYPHGRLFLDTEGKEAQLERWWPESSRATFEALLDNMNLSVHEGCHDFHWSRHEPGLYVLDPSYSGDRLYNVAQTAPTGGNWPTRGSIQPLMPSFMNDNGFYTLYFTNREMDGMAEDDIAGLLDEYACYVHGDAAAMPLNLMDNAGEDLASFMLFSVLYLRKMQADRPGDFEHIVQTEELRQLFLLLHDRAEFVIAEGQRRGLVDEGRVRPILDELQRDENVAILDRLRAPDC